MALIRWNSFACTYPRSFLIDGVVAGARTQTSYEVMHRLVEDSAPAGAYALRPTDGVIHARFAEMSDAQKFAAKVGARQVEGEGSMAPYWTFGLDMEKFAATRARGPSTGRRPGGRRARALPF